MGCLQLHRFSNTVERGPVAVDTVGEFRVGHLFTPSGILVAPLCRGCGWAAAATERALRCARRIRQQINRARGAHHLGEEMGRLVVGWQATFSSYFRSSISSGTENAVQPNKGSQALGSSAFKLADESIVLIAEIKVNRRECREMSQEAAPVGKFDVKDDYVLGKSAAETDRLVAQAAIIQPITQRLLSKAGLKPGMRVLDVGCGAGDVALLASEMVGPGGSVIGIDHNASVLAHARARAQTVGYHNVEFQEHSLASFSDPNGFDLVVGRYVFVHQDDPTAFLRRTRSFVRPGGALAFHEPSLLPGQFSTPPVELYENMFDTMMRIFPVVIPHYDAPRFFLSYFHKAGLPEPSLFSETPIGGGEHSLFYAWVADTFQSVRPVIEKHGLWRHGAMPGDNVERDLRAACVSLHSQVRLSHQICAWVKL